jgi:hypothetical protein
MLAKVPEKTGKAPKSEVEKPRIKEQNCQETEFNPLKAP